MTDVLLIHPRLEVHGSPPLGLGYIAAVLEKNGFTVSIFDFNQKRHLSDDMASLKTVIGSEKPKLVGIGCLTSYYPEAKKLAKFVKNCDKNAKIIMGGVHPSCYPDLILQDDNIDFVAVGEGEFITLELCRCLNTPENYESIDGLGFKKNGQILINKPRKLIEDLDSLPFPSWHLMAPSLYPPSPQGFFFTNYPIAPLMTSRGCPYSCTFCASRGFWRGRCRVRSPANVLSEITLLKEKFGVKEFQISDDNFTLDRKRALKICEGIIEANLDITWSCPNGIRVDRVDRELIRKMKQAGCQYVSFGIESASQKVLDRVKKKINLLQVKKAVDICRQEHLIAGGFFILGLPCETRETALETIRFAFELKLDIALFHVFTPLPGSIEFQNWVEKKGIDVAHLDFSEINTYRGASGDHETELTLEELIRMRNKAFLEFYLRPSVILSILRRTKPSQLPWLFKRLLTLGQQDKTHTTRNQRGSY